MSESLDGTGTRKVSQVPRSKPPKTQNPSIHLLLLYFWWPILASSISTVLPGPPKTSERCSIQNWHTSLQNEPQSVTLFWLMANSRDIWRLLGWGNTNHREQKRQIVFEKISAYRTMFPLPSSLRMNVFSWPSIAPRVIWQLPADRSETASAACQLDTPGGTRRRSTYQRQRDAPPGSLASGPGRQSRWQSRVPYTDIRGTTFRVYRIYTEQWRHYVKGTEELIWP